jgi:uncharacterized protein YukE
MPIEISLPEIPGDPQGMRNLAADLQRDARAIEDVAARIGSAVGSMTFEGPAATVFKDKTQAAGKRLGDFAHQLDELARRLNVSAAEVEQKQRDRLARLQQMREEFAEQGVPVMVVP